jgi:hypothetical protein
MKRTYEDYEKWAHKVKALPIAELEAALAAFCVDLTGDYITRNNVCVVRFDAGEWEAYVYTDSTHYVDINPGDWWPGATALEASMRAIYAELVQ